MSRDCRGLVVGGEADRVMSIAYARLRNNSFFRGVGYSYCWSDLQLKQIKILKGR